MRPDPLPVLTIGGYLGSGKTTLVNHLLRHANGRRLAILVNEFGDLPIDEDLIEAEDDAMISIAGGCICCSFGNDLMAALGDMAQLQPRPDTVIIESSGVAIPGAIVATLSLLPGVRSDGTIVVVDAETVRTAARDDYIGDTILRQLADAEGVVINKTDLIDADTARDLSDWLSEVAPGAFQLPARFGQLLPDALLGVVENPGTGRVAAHSDDLFESHVLTPVGAVDPGALAEALSTGGHGVIRAKGHVTGHDGALWLVQTVGARAYVQPASKVHDPGLICLGLRGRMDCAALERLAITPIATPTPAASPAAS